MARSPMTGLDCGYSVIACRATRGASGCFARQEKRQFEVPMAPRRPDGWRKCPACGSSVLERDTLAGWVIACHTRKARGRGGTCEVGVQLRGSGTLWWFMQVRRGEGAA